MSQANTCGTCRLCCKLLGVSELQKPIGTMCSHACSSGCSIYAFRPQSCAKYECLWLQSQSTTLPLGVECRPDQIGIIFDTLVKDPDTVMARVRDGESNRLDGAVARKVINILLKLKRYIVVTSGAKREVIVRDPKDLDQKFTDHGETLRGRLWR